MFQMAEFKQTEEAYKILLCPRSSGPFYILTYYMKWVTTSWTDGIRISKLRFQF